MLIQPYLFFEGRCEEAVDFYRTALGAEVTALMRVKDSPEPPMMPPGSDNKILHVALRIGDTMLMGSDGMCSGKPRFEGFSLTLNATDGAHAQRLFDALADGGQVRMPLIKTFFSSHFGMLADRFGVPWMVLVPV